MCMHVCVCEILPFAKINTFNHNQDKDLTTLHMILDDNVVKRTVLIESEREGGRTREKDCKLRVTTCKQRKIRLQKLKSNTQIVDDVA